MKVKITMHRTLYNEQSFVTHTKVVLETEPGLFKVDEVGNVRIYSLDASKLKNPATSQEAVRLQDMYSAHTIDELHIAYE